MDIYIGRASQAVDFREAIYSGAIFLNTTLQSAQDLVDHAIVCATEIFNNPSDLRTVHNSLKVEEFVSLVTALKGKFTNSERSKELIRAFVLEVGEDLNEYLFDVPRLRVVPNYEYLHAGVSYAYRPHRDTWYGSPPCQINTWMPVFPIKPEQTMMINPAYFDRPVKNTSAEWSLRDWITARRWTAKDNIREENRVHPVPLDIIDPTGEIRFAGDRGDTIIFSGAQLHGTVPNYTNHVRFSIDFRLIRIADLMAGRGAKNVDSACKDVEAGFKDYFRVSDFARFEEIAR